MKQTVSTRLISFLLVLAMVLSMVPTAPIHAHAALTGSEIDELNDKWNLDIEFDPDNPDKTPEEALSAKSDAKQHISYPVTEDLITHWRQIEKNGFTNKGGDLRKYLESTDPDDKYIAIVEDLKCTSSHEDYQTIVITADKVLDLNGHTIELYDQRNKVDMSGQAGQSYDQSTTESDHYSVMFEIQNGATLTIIDSSEYGMKNGKYVKGESTGKIFANAMMINHQKWDLHYYTHRDIFLVSDGNLVIHGGTFQAGRQDDQYASNFSWNALKEVIGQAVTLGVSVYTYATGLDAAVAAKEDFMETDYYKDTEETPEEGDSGSDSGGTTKKDGENGKPTKDSKEDTPTADGNEAAKKDQTVASKQSAKNNPEGVAQEQATRGDDSEENEADEEKVAKKGQNTKVAEFNKNIAGAALNKDAISGMVDSAFALGEGIYNMCKSNTDSRATACIQGTVAKVGNMGTLVVYGGSFSGYGSTPNVRNGVIEVERKSIRNTDVDSPLYGTYTGGLVYIYDGDFQAFTGANVFNLVESNRNQETWVIKEKDANGNPVYETVELSVNETTGVRVMQYEDYDQWLRKYGAKTDAQKAADPGPKIVNTNNIMVRGGTFRCHYELTNMAVITHEESREKVEGQSGDRNFHRFNGTPGTVNLGVDSYGKDMIRDGRIQIVDAYGQGALVLLDGGEPIVYSTTEEETGGSLEENTYQTDGGYRNYRLFVSDEELRISTYLHVYPNDAKTNSSFSFNLRTYYGQGKTQEDAWASDDNNRRAPYSSNERFFEFPFDDLDTTANSGAAPTYFLVPNLKNTNPNGQNLDAATVWYYNSPVNQDLEIIEDFSYSDVYALKNVDGTTMYNSLSGSKLEDWLKENDGVTDGKKILNDSYMTSMKYFVYKIYRVDPLTRENISESKVYGVDEPLFEIRYGADTDSLKCRLGLMDMQEYIKSSGKRPNWKGYQKGELYRVVFSVEEHVGAGYLGTESNGTPVYQNYLQPATAESSILFRCVGKDEVKLGTYTDPNTGAEKTGLLPDFTPLQMNSNVAAGTYATVELMNGWTGMIDYTEAKVFDIYYQWWECDKDGNDIRMLAGTDNIWIAQETESGKDNHKPALWVVNPATGQGVNGEQYYNTVDPRMPGAEDLNVNGLPQDPRTWTFDMLHMYTQETVGAHIGLREDETKDLSLGNNNRYWGKTDSCYIPEEMAGKYIKVKLIAVNCQYPLIYDNLQTVESHAVQVGEPTYVDEIFLYNEHIQANSWLHDLTPTWSTAVNLYNGTWYQMGGESNYIELDQEKDSFEAGKTYCYRAELMPQSGYLFSEGYTVEMNGMKAHFVGQQPNDLGQLVDVWECFFSFGDIDYAGIIEIMRPAPGATPDFTGSIQYAGTASYEIKWYEADENGNTVGEALAEDFVYEEDTKYRVEVTMTAREGQGYGYYGSDIDDGMGYVEINEKETWNPYDPNEIGWYYLPSETSQIVVWAVYDTADCITAVDLYGIQHPFAAKNVDTTLLMGSDRYTLVPENEGDPLLNWDWSSSGGGYGNVDDGKYRNDKTHWLEGNLEAADGYWFAANKNGSAIVDYYFNGHEVGGADYWYGTYGGAERGAVEYIAFGQWFENYLKLTDCVLVNGIMLLDGDYLAIDGLRPVTEQPTGGYAYYNEGVLTLNNFQLSADNTYPAIYSAEALTIRVVGTNTLDADSDTIDIRNDLTLEGTGILNATATGSAIFAVGNVTVNSGTYNLDGERSGLWIVNYSNEISLTMNGGTVTCNGDTCGIEDDGNELPINMNGGILTATCGTSYPMFAMLNGTGLSVTVADNAEGTGATAWDNTTDLKTYKYVRIEVTCTEHSWIDATCDTPKTCSNCGITEGEALGHTWASDCVTVKHCTVCGFIEGTLGDHNWQAADCVNPKTCTICGLTEGEPTGHNYADPTCTDPATCTGCGITYGEPNGHRWLEATCTEPERCEVCNATQGEALGHDWVDATENDPKHCSRCQITEGEPLPTEPAPTDPAPTDPAPTDPAPTDPAPTDPAPTDPAPTDPAPTDPAPTDPEPTDPAPTDPAPTDPVPVTYTVAAIASPSTGGTVTGAGTYEEGTSVTVTATANAGYHFVKWTEGGAEVSTNASYTFTIAANRNLVAVFEADAPTPPPAGGTLNGMFRLAGPSRYDTGFAIANKLKEILGVDKFSAVIVAYGQNFPDALTGSYLAAVKGAPILLTEPSADATLLSYLKTNLVSGGKVYILGGTAAVSQAFEDGAKAFGFDVKRLKGAGRYETNLEILKEAGVNTTDEVLIATGKNYADSLSASATGLPMLLVDKNLTDSQKAFLQGTSKKFVILGGTGAVSAEVEAELDAIGDVTRVKGASRYGTSVEIAKRYFNAPSAAVLAYAQGFPDGLCGGPLAFAVGAPLILTSNESSALADEYVAGISNGAVTGGTARISDDTVREIFDLPANTPIVKP